MKSANEFAIGIRLRSKTNGERKQTIRKANLVGKKRTKFENNVGKWRNEGWKEEK